MGGPGAISERVDTLRRRRLRTVRADLDLGAFGG
jgi:hypothetical protein